MTIENLLNEGYFPKELPPCFHTYLFGKNYHTVVAEFNTSKKKELDKLLQGVQKNKKLSPTDKSEETVRIRQIFENKFAYSDPISFSIPKPGLSRNYVKIINPIHQGKLSEVIANNFTDISKLYSESTFSITKPLIDTETGYDRRAIKHDNYTFFKEQCIINSFKYSINLKSDISKYYPSIYTHSVPWVTFGGKNKYKHNRSLSNKDPKKITKIYGDDIDNCLTWCQGQQTMGIPIGPDTSLIIAEIIGCHIDKLLFNFLKKKKIDFKGFRYYDDISLFFNNELDAQYALSELKKITNEFELKLNDSKTSITKANNELEKEWALELKKFYFRPSKYHQREDLWNYFAIAFKYTHHYPDAAVLKLAVNKFFYVRIEKENWDYFQSLLFRLTLLDTSSIQKVSKILITYKQIVNKTMLKDFCHELIERHYVNRNDYELSWSLWLMKEFEMQPTKEIFLKIFESKSVCAIIIALDLLSANKKIKNIDLSNITDKIKTENLNTKYWLLVYEAVFNKWDKKISPQFLDHHLYFKILRKNNINFYNSKRTLEPLKIEHSHFENIEKKINQIERYIDKNDIKNDKVKKDILNLKSYLVISQSNSKSKDVIQNNLINAETSINTLIDEIEKIKISLTKFDKRRPYYVVGKRLEELGELTSKEINSESNENRNLLFDPEYD